MSEIGGLFLLFISKRHPLSFLLFAKRKKLPLLPFLPYHFFMPKTFAFRPFALSPLTMRAHYPHGSSGVEPLDFEHCVLIWGLRQIFNLWGEAGGIGRINERVALSQRDPIAERVVSYS